MARMSSEVISLLIRGLVAALPEYSLDVVDNNGPLVIHRAFRSKKKYYYAFFDKLTRPANGPDFTFVAGFKDGKFAHDFYRVDIASGNPGEPTACATLLRQVIADPLSIAVYSCNRELEEYVFHELAKIKTRSAFMEIVGRIWAAEMLAIPRKCRVDMHMRRILTIGNKFGITVLDMNDLHERIVRNRAAALSII